jgi:carnitine O-acetyltransferase
MAQEQYTRLTSQYELQVVDFQGYGKKYLKSKGELFSSTPGSGHVDAVVQMAMQLAAYRLFQGKKQVATYEAALARYFLHGRTATARPVSPASNAFLQAMGVEAYSDKTSSSTANKMQALRLATKALEEYQAKASNGMCVDRHLFGLSMMMKQDDDDDKNAAPPRLFQDALYQRSKHWVLSTSAFIFCPGFGPVTDDGMGIGYLVDGNSCLFTVSSRKENNAVGPYCELLQEALTEIGQVIDEATTTATSSLSSSSCLTKGE